MEIHEESVMVYILSLGVRKLVVNEGDPDKRYVQTGLADWIG
jgi:hypothetical protein